MGKTALFVALVSFTSGCASFGTRHPASDVEAQASRLNFSVDALQVAAQLHGLTVESIALHAANVSKSDLAGYKAIYTRTSQQETERKKNLSDARQKFIGEFSCADLADQIILAQMEIGALNVDRLYVGAKPGLPIVRLKFPSEESFNRAFNQAAERAADLRNSILNQCRVQSN
ncbi:MAG: hypothetical protein KF802_03150 [Bdellovibrionaceae bacterium]|nr:hypothetical protein [Pseudobdellovibrionaceae bacterium]